MLILLGFNFTGWCDGATGIEYSDMRSQPGTATHLRFICDKEP